METTINDLPPEMVGQLLRHLNLGELIEKKRVCKLWNEIISSQLKVSRLFVELHNRPKKREPWWQVNRPVDEYLEVCSVYLFVQLVQSPILANLRHLRIDVFDDHDYLKFRDFNPNDLNAFSKLVQLEIDFLINGPIPKIDWNLPNLEILRFRFWLAEEQENEFQISINCPKLKVLFYEKNRKDDLIEVKSPETITTLVFSHFDGLELAKFKNIEIFKCSSGLNSINDTLIEQLPKWKRFEMNEQLQNVHNELGSVERIKQFLKHLLSQRRKFRRFDLKLFFAGVYISDESLVDHLNLQVVEFSEDYPARLSNEHFYFGDYPADCKLNLIDELEFVQHVNYSSLMSLVNEIPVGYFKRFWRIKQLVTNGVIQDPEHFAFYIKQLQYLDDLSLHYPGLPQEWYDRLPEICSPQNFTLYKKNEIKLNFDFLFERHVIFFLFVNENDDFSLRSAGSIPNLIKFYRAWWKNKFKFNFRGVKVMIRMRGSESDQSDGSEASNVEAEGDYDVLINKKLKLERANSMEVLDYFKGLEGTLD